MALFRHRLWRSTSRHSSSTSIDSILCSCCCPDLPPQCLNGTFSKTLLQLPVTVHSTLVTVTYWHNWPTAQVPRQTRGARAATSPVTATCPRHNGSMAMSGYAYPCSYGYYNIYAKRSSLLCCLVVERALFVCQQDDTTVHACQKLLMSCMYVTIAPVDSEQL